MSSQHANFNFLVFHSAAYLKTIYKRSKLHTKHAANSFAHHIESDPDRKSEKEENIVLQLARNKSYVISSCCTP